MPNDDLKSLMYETAAELIVIGLKDGAKLVTIANLPWWLDKEKRSEIIREKLGEGKEIVQYLREKAKEYKK